MSIQDGQATRPLTPDRADASMQRGGRIVLVAVIALVFAAGVLAGADGFSLLTEVPYLVVGAVLAVRRPGNSIGWILLVIGAVGVLSAPQVAGPTAPLVTGTAPAGERLLVWVAAASGAITVACYAALAIVFPSGHLPGRRWGGVARVILVVNVVGIAGALIGPTIRANLVDGRTIDVANPFQLLPAGPWFDLLNGPAGSVVALGTVLLSVTSIVLRLHRARGIEHQQLRWVVASLVASCLAVVVAMFSGQPAFAFLVFTLIPGAIGIAVLRYRLYEIDRLISRTIGWAVVTVVLGATFAGVVLAFDAVLAPVTRTSSLDVAGSTLVVYALFSPVRRRVQRLVDRRFNRRRADDERIAASLAARLRHEVDLDALRAEFLVTIGQALEPASARLWLR